MKINASLKQLANFPFYTFLVIIIIKRADAERTADI